MNIPVTRLETSIKRIDTQLYNEFIGRDMRRIVFRPRRIERRWFALDSRAHEVWRGSDLVDPIDPLSEVMGELENAAYEKHKLGGYFCQIPDRAKGEWTFRPDMIARELNLSNLFTFQVSPMLVVQSQHELGVWEKRRRRAVWEYETLGLTPPKMPRYVQ